MQDPIASLGIVSAAGYSHRRNTSRQTFLRSAGLHSLVVRFVVLTRMQDGTKEDEMVALEAERLGDVVRVPWSGSRARVSAPVVALFGWLREATSKAPYRSSSFILKADDDAYVVVPQLVRQLQLIQDRGVSETGHVYFGRIFWTAWEVANYTHQGTGYSYTTPLWRAGDCLRHHECAGPYPFATASLQGVSIALANELANSPAVQTNVNGTQLLDPDRRVPAFEDAWMGFAVAALLPRATSRQVALVSIHPIYFRDDYGFGMHNYTMLVHPRANKDNPSLHLARFRAADWYTESFHCRSNPQLTCNVRNHAGAWALLYPTTESASKARGTTCHGCVPGRKWRICSLEPASGNRSACNNFHMDNWPTNDLLARFGPRANPPWVQPHDRKFSLS